MAERRDYNIIIKKDGKPRTLEQVFGKSASQKTIQAKNF